jgi:hypothetical protein
MSIQDQLRLVEEGMSLPGWLAARFKWWWFSHRWEETLPC